MARLTPATPSFMDAKPLPDIPPGQDVRVTAGQQRAAAAELNGRLADSRKWYENVRKEFAQ